MFSGMLGVTLFGILFTPVFYVVVRWLTERQAPTPGHTPVAATAFIGPQGDEQTVPPSKQPEHVP